MAKYNYKGVIVAAIVSFCAIPCTRIALEDVIVSQFAPMYILNYALLLTASVFFITALPPTLCRSREKGPVKRNEIYYGSCLLMCCCLAGLTLQTVRLKKFGAQKIKHKMGYLVYDELYVLTPFGMSTEIWMDIINYFFYAVFIFMIDNNYSYRDLILYWSGATLTSEMVATLACFTGSQSHMLQYSEFMHIVHVGAASWVIFKFIFLKPRRIDGPRCISKYATLDKCLVICLILYSFFAVFRGLAALNGNQRWVKSYVMQAEPYIVHPSRFPAIWILYLAVYGIPFQLVTARVLTRPGLGAEWLVNMSILYAGSILQGTFVFLSYSFYPSAEAKFKLPKKYFFYVLGINLLLVIVTHVLAYRCLKEPCYFNKPCLKVLVPGSRLNNVTIEEKESQHSCPQSEDSDCSDNEIPSRRRCC